ncbi:MAG TPA: MFS transporter [Caldimonas sp.]|nr:MFS transporter [Caldimonas sp.]
MKTSLPAVAIAPASVVAAPSATIPGALAVPTGAAPTSAGSISGAAAPAATGSPWLVFFVASIAVFLVAIDSTVLYAAFAALRRAFPEARAADLSWVLNAYTVVYAALLVPSGRLADLYGRKRIFATGVSIFLLASLACGLSTHVALLIAARVAQAVGAALLTPASLAIVLAAFPASRRAVVVAAWGAVGGLAAALGPSVGSWVVDAWGWPWAFFINLPLGALSLWRGRGALAESRNPENAAPLDIVGVLLLIGGVGAIAFGLVRIDALGWDSPVVLGCAAAGAALLACFVAWARHAASPAIDLTLFDSPTYRWVNLATLSFGIAFAMMFFGFFLFMTAVWHFSLPEAGLAITPGPLMVVPTAIVSGRIAARIGHRPLLVVGSVVYACGGLWFRLVPGIAPDYLHHWLPGLFLTGIGVGMVLPSLSGAAVAQLAPNRFGIGSAVNQAVRQVGSVLGVAVTIVLVGKTAPQLVDFHHLYDGHVALALLTALLCLRVQTRPRAPA